MTMTITIEVYVTEEMLQNAQLVADKSNEEAKAKGKTPHHTAQTIIEMAAEHSFGCSGGKNLAWYARSIQKQKVNS